jgi:hypothetical protein
MEGTNNFLSMIKSKIVVKETEKMITSKLFSRTKDIYSSSGKGTENNTIIDSENQ